MAVRLNFLSVKPEACLPNSLCRVALPLAVLLCGAVGQAAEVHPLAVQQTRYEMRVGESVQIAVPPETLDFLLKAANLRVDLVGAGATLAAGPNRAHDQVR